MYGKLAYSSIKLRYAAILNNQIQQVPETRWSGLPMTSVLSHWLTTEPFVL